MDQTVKEFRLFPIKHGGRLKGFEKESDNAKLLFKKGLMGICRIKRKWVRQ